MHQQRHLQVVHFFASEYGSLRIFAAFILCSGSSGPETVPLSTEQRGMRACSFAETRNYSCLRTSISCILRLQFFVCSSNGAFGGFFVQRVLLFFQEVGVHLLFSLLAMQTAVLLDCSPCVQHFQSFFCTPCFMRCSSIFNLHLL